MSRKPPTPTSSCPPQLWLHYNSRILSPITNCMLHCVAQQIKVKNRRIPSQVWKWKGEEFCMHSNCKSLHVVIIHLNTFSMFDFTTLHYLINQIKILLVTTTKIPHQKAPLIVKPSFWTKMKFIEKSNWLLVGCAFRKDPIEKPHLLYQNFEKTNSFSLVYSSFKCTTRCTPLTFLSMIGPGCLARPLFPSESNKNTIPFFPPIFHLLLLPKSSSNSLLSQKQPSSSNEIFFA